MRIAIGAVVLVTAFVASPLGAKSPRDIICNAISKTADGKFTYGQLRGLSIIRVVNEDKPFSVEGAPEIVGFACARTDIVPIVNDVKVLQAGYSLSIGAAKGGGITTIELELKDGRVVADTQRANLSASEQRDLAEVVHRMQSVIDAGKNAQP